MSTDYQREIDKALLMHDRLERALYVVGLWTELLHDAGITPVVVGGAAVEFYTFGAYMTYDIDLVAPGRTEALAKLETLGFERTETLRHWYHPHLAMVIEIPAEQLVGSEEHIVRVEVGPYVAHVIGVEDLILDRLRAYVHWKSSADGEWARRLALLHSEAIDWTYLNKTAADEALLDALNEMLAQNDERNG